MSAPAAWGRRPGSLFPCSHSALLGVDNLRGLCYGLSSNPKSCDSVPGLFPASRQLCGGSFPTCHHGRNRSGDKITNLSLRQGSCQDEREIPAWSAQTVCSALRIWSRCARIPIRVYDQDRRGVWRLCLRASGLGETVLRQPSRANSGSTDHQGKKLSQTAPPDAPPCVRSKGKVWSFRTASRGRGTDRLFKAVFTPGT